MKDIVIAVIKSITMLVLAFILLKAYSINADQKKREIIAAVVISGNDPIKVVCAVDGSTLASRKMCIESAR